MCLPDKMFSVLFFQCRKTNRSILFNFIRNKHLADFPLWVVRYKSRFEEVTSVKPSENLLFPKNNENTDKNCQNLLFITLESN